MNHRTVPLLDVCVKCESISSELWAGVLGKPFETQQLASFLKNEVHHSQLTKPSHPRVLKSWFLFGESRLKASNRRGGLKPLLETGFPGTWTLRNEVVKSELCLIY